MQGKIRNERSNAGTDSNAQRVGVQVLIESEWTPSPACPRQIRTVKRGRVKNISLNITLWTRNPKNGRGNAFQSLRYRTNLQNFTLGSPLKTQETQTCLRIKKQKLTLIKNLLQIRPIKKSIARVTDPTVPVNSHQT